MTTQCARGLHSELALAAGPCSTHYSPRAPCSALWPPRDFLWGCIQTSAFTSRKKSLAKKVCVSQDAQQPLTQLTFPLPQAKRSQVQLRESQATLSNKSSSELRATRQRSQSASRLLHTGDQPPPASSHREDHNKGRSPETDVRTTALRQTACAGLQGRSRMPWSQTRPLNRTLRSGLRIALRQCCIERRARRAHAELRRPAAPSGSQGHLAAISGRPQAALTAAGPRLPAARRERLGAAQPASPRLRNRYRGTERRSATAKFKGSPSSRAGRGEPPAAPPSPHAGGGAAPCPPRPSLTASGWRRTPPPPPVPPPPPSVALRPPPVPLRCQPAAPRLPAGLTRPAGLRRRSLARDKPPRARERSGAPYGRRREGAGREAGSAIGRAPALIPPPRSSSSRRGVAERWRHPGQRGACQGNAQGLAAAEWGGQPRPRETRWGGAGPWNRLSSSRRAPPMAPPRGTAARAENVLNCCWATVVYEQGQWRNG